ncbi:hypothetical protein B0A52_02129 [Exophiala mesophila]|uniref:RRM domain-containing protein n=1 Tax=Exophiala mesophila TaxID=212818 RepID=A0A438NEY0_EXOME|nr:hypothetical protein B0A52_02129 [Exophiala mesophila]
MSGRLDQSLQSIIDTSNKAKREARRRKGVKPKTTAAVPVGGVKKTTRPVKSAIKPTTGQTQPSRNSKIVVSGLPHDVNESQIKEYFNKSVGFVKRVSLQYNQSGQSRGIADILFGKADSAAKAAKELNGMLIEVVVDASSVPQPAAPKPLAERVAANPKAQPKSAVNVKKATAKDGAKGKGAGKDAKPKRGRNARPKKTAEELDAEMTDYWGGNNPSATGAAPAAPANGANPAPAGGDEAMDEIS